MAIEWTDKALMPFGKYRGKNLADIPPSYLLWLYEQPWIKEHHQLYAYLKKNEDLLIEERCEQDRDNEWMDMPDWDDD